MRDITPKKSLRLFQMDKIRNSNVIIELMKNLKNSNVKDLKEVLSTLEVIFRQLLLEGDIKVPRNIPDDARSAKDTYHLWLYERYQEFYLELQNLFDHKYFQIGRLALKIYLELMRIEGCNPISKKDKSKISFPISKLKNALEYMLSKSVSYEILITKTLNQYFIHPDFLFYILQILSSIVKNWKSSQKNEIWIENFFYILQLLELPDETKNPLEPPRNFMDPQEEESDDKLYNFAFPHKKAKGFFNGIWEEVIEWNLPQKLVKRCLIILPEKVLMHLNDPICLTDFFMNAYNTGGASSIMALHGIFILITEFNMEYPDFYKKLYALFNPTIFDVRYRKKFFILSSKFLTSPLLPEYYLAAFLKKICRLMLIAPSSCLVMLLKFAVNILVRNPSLHRMLHSTDVTCLENDPYDEEENDPALCHAGESSLWEVATLRQHPLPGVSKAANFIWRNLPDIEYDLKKHLELDFDELFHKASKIRIPEVEVVFMKPTSLCCLTDDEISSEWKAF